MVRLKIMVVYQSSFDTTCKIYLLLFGLHWEVLTIGKGTMLMS